MVRHPALAVPHLSLAHIGHLDFEGLKAIGCKGIVFDKVRNGVPNLSLTTRESSFNIVARVFPLGWKRAYQESWDGGRPP